jgi:hypothetical protein
MVEVIIGPLELYSKSYDCIILINTARARRTKRIIHIAKE